MNRRLLLVVPLVACLLLTSVFAFLVLSSSVKSEPSPPYVPVPDLPSCYQPGMTQRQINACVANEQAVWAQYQQAVKVAELQSGYFGQFAIYNDYLSNSMKLWEAGTVTVMVLVFSLAAWFPERRSAKVPATIALICGSAVFAFWVWYDYTGPVHFQLDYPSLHAFVSFLGDHMQFNDGWGFSAFSSFCMATAGFAALRIRRSFVKAVFESVTLFAAPALVAFEVGLLYRIPVWFNAQVTNFVTWITNGDVLFVALCFIGVGFVPFLARMELRREERMLAGFGP